MVRGLVDRLVGRVGGGFPGPFWSVNSGGGGIGIY